MKYGTALVGIFVAFVIGISAWSYYHPPAPTTGWAAFPPGKPGQCLKVQSDGTNWYWRDCAPPRPRVKPVSHLNWSVIGTGSTYTIDAKDLGKTVMGSNGTTTQIATPGTWSYGPIKASDVGKCVISPVYPLEWSIGKCPR